MRGYFKPAVAAVLLGSAVSALAAAQAAQTAPADPPLAIAPDSASLTWGPCPPIFPGDCRIAVLHGNPAAPNADVLLKVGPGAVLPRHRHTSAERMILVSGRMRVKYDGADEVMLEPGSYAYGPAGLPHEASCVSATPCRLFIAFEGPVDAHLETPAAG